LQIIKWQEGLWQLSANLEVVNGGASHFNRFANYCVHSVTHDFRHGNLVSLMTRPAYVSQTTVLTNKRM
jgi:hypothetical protein